MSPPPKLTTAPTTLLICWLGCLSPTSALAQDAAERTTQVHEVADLIEPDDLLREPSVMASPRENQGSRDGGGGMFSIPSTATNLVQFGGGGGGTDGGFAGGMPGPLPPKSRIDQLADLVIAHTESPEHSWEAYGGSGVLTAHDTSLVVTQTPAGQRAVGDLLESLRAAAGRSTPVLVELRVVAVPPPKPTDKLAGGQAIDAAALAGGPGAQGVTLLCRSSRIVEIQSGLRRTYTVNVTPVVGGVGVPDRSIGYQAVTETFLLGLMGRLSVQPNAAGDAATVKLGVRLTLGPEQVEATEFADGLTYDRVDIDTTELRTQLAAPAGQWTVAGILPSEAIASPSTEPELMANHAAFLLRWNVAR